MSVRSTAGSTTGGRPPPSPPAAQPEQHQDGDDAEHHRSFPAPWDDGVVRGERRGRHEHRADEPHDERRPPVDLLVLGERERDGAQQQVRRREHAEPEQQEQLLPPAVLAEPPDHEVGDGQGDAALGGLEDEVHPGCPVGEPQRRHDDDEQRHAQGDRCGRGGQPAGLDAARWLRAHLRHSRCNSDDTGVRRPYRPRLTPRRHHSGTTATTSPRPRPPPARPASPSAPSTSKYAALGRPARQRRGAHLRRTRRLGGRSRGDDRDPRQRRSSADGSGQRPVAQQDAAEARGLLRAAAHELDEPPLDRHLVVADDLHQQLDVAGAQGDPVARRSAADGVEQEQVRRVDLAVVGGVAQPARPAVDGDAPVLDLDRAARRQQVRQVGAVRGAEPLDLARQRSAAAALQRCEVGAQQPGRTGCVVERQAGALAGVLQALLHGGRRLLRPDGGLRHGSPIGRLRRTMSSRTAKESWQRVLCGLRSSACPHRSSPPSR